MFAVSGRSFFFFHLFWHFVLQTEISQQLGLNEGTHSGSPEEESIRPLLTPWLTSRTTRMSNFLLIQLLLLIVMSIFTVCIAANFCTDSHVRLRVTRYNFNPFSQVNMGLFQERIPSPTLTLSMQSCGSLTAPPFMRSSHPDVRWSASGVLTPTGQLVILFHITLVLFIYWFCPPAPPTAESPLLEISKRIDYAILH